MQRQEIVGKAGLRCGGQHKKDHQRAVEGGESGVALERETGAVNHFDQQYRKRFGNLLNDEPIGPWLLDKNRRAELDAVHYLGTDDTYLDTFIEWRETKITEEQRERFVQLYLAAADRAGLPSDHAFREALRSHVEFGSHVARQNSHAETDDQLHPLREVPMWQWPDVAP